MVLPEFCKKYFYKSVFNGRLMLEPIEFVMSSHVSKQHVPIIRVNSWCKHFHIIATLCSTTSKC